MLGPNVSLENGLRLFSESSGLWEKAVVFLLCSGCQFPVWVKAQPRLSVCVWEFGTTGLCSLLLSVLVLSCWTGFKPWANGTNVIQHRYVLLLKKCCIISLTQKKFPLNPEAPCSSPSPWALSGLCLCSWIPSISGLVHGLRAKTSPAPALSPSASQGLHG